MKMQPTEDGGFEQVGMPTQAERELGDRILAEKIEPGSKASVFLGIELLRKKEGFHTLEELKQQKELFTRQYGSLDGQFLLIEMNYFERTCFGGPGSDLGLAESTGYILGVIDSSVSHGEEISDKILVPVAKHVKWEKYASIFDNFACSENLLCLDTHNSFASYGGGAQYRILVGNLEVMHAISRIELYKKERGIAGQLLLNFWKASQAVGVDTSDYSPIARALEAGREEALYVYVRGKALLFADESSGVNRLFTSDGRRSLDVKVNEAHQKLLDLGLSEEAIAYRAKELALKLLDF